MSEAAWNAGFDAGREGALRNVLRCAERMKELEESRDLFELAMNREEKLRKEAQAQRDEWVAHVEGEKSALEARVKELEKALEAERDPNSEGTLAFKLGIVVYDRDRLQRLYDQADLAVAEFERDRNRLREALRHVRSELSGGEVYLRDFIDGIEQESRPRQWGYGRKPEGSEPSVHDDFGRYDGRDASLWGDGT